MIRSIRVGGCWTEVYVLYNVSRFRESGDDDGVGSGCGTVRRRSIFFCCRWLDTARAADRRARGALSKQQSPEHRARNDRRVDGHDRLLYQYTNTTTITAGLSSHLSQILSSFLSLSPCVADVATRVERDQRSVADEGRLAISHKVLIPARAGQAGPASGQAQLRL